MIPTFRSHRLVPSRSQRGSDGDGEDEDGGFGEGGGGRCQFEGRGAGGDDDDDDSRCLYAVLVHRQYSERVREALDPPSDERWIDVDPSGKKKIETAPAGNRGEAGGGGGEDVRGVGRRRCRHAVLEERRNRRRNDGYVLLVDATRSPADGAVNAAGRRQISWAGRMTHGAVAVTVRPAGEGGGGGGAVVARGGANDGLKLEEYAIECMYARLREFCLRHRGAGASPAGGGAGDDDGPPDDSSSPSSSQEVGTATATSSSRRRRRRWWAELRLRIDVQPKTKSLNDAVVGRFRELARLDLSAAAAEEEGGKEEGKEEWEGLIRNQKRHRPSSDDGAVAAAMAATEESGGGDSNDVDVGDDGPIELTRSATSATVVASLVRVSDGEYQYGVCTAGRAWGGLNGTLNDRAAEEMVVAPEPEEEEGGGPEEPGQEPKTQPGRGEDGDGSGGGGARVGPASDVPVSRAYYKLEQVVAEYVAPLLCGAGGGGGAAGLDLGAAPGGWTQVLCHKVGLRKVVAIDPANLARRVLAPTTPGDDTPRVVHHVRADFTSDEAAAAIARHAPYSLVVCDASSDARRVLGMLEGMFAKAKAAAASSVAGVVEVGGGEGDSTEEDPTGEGGGRLQRGRALLALPAVLVLTLKFPHKTPGSVKRHVDMSLREIPPRLRRIVDLATTAVATTDGDGTAETHDAAADAVGVRFRLLHLMANSASERTLVAIVGGR